MDMAGITDGATRDILNYVAEFLQVGDSANKSTVTLLARHNAALPYLNPGHE